MIKQLLNKHVKQKTKINKLSGKLYYSIEINQEGINKINKEIGTVKRGISERKNRNKNYDLSLRITELKNSIVHYENNILVLKDRIIDFEGINFDILIKIKRIRYNYESLKGISVRCDVCKNDIHRVSYSRHLKSKKHLESVQQNKVNFPRKK